MGYKTAVNGQPWKAEDCLFWGLGFSDKDILEEWERSGTVYEMVKVFRESTKPMCRLKNIPCSFGLNTLSPPENCPLRKGPIEISLIEV